MRTIIALVLTCCAALCAADVGQVIREGEAKLQAGELDAAVAILRSAVAADPDSALARTRLGGALLLKQDLGAAVEQFREAIALDPASADAFVGMAIAEIHLGRYGLARAALEEARGIDPAKQGQVDPVIAWLDARADESSH